VNTGLGGIGGSVGMECNAGPMTAPPLPANILIVLDTSVSMNDAIDDTCAMGGCDPVSKWDLASSSINGVVSAPGPAVNWGLEFFNNNGGGACDAGGITTPVGPANATSIRSELSRRSAAGTLVSPGNSPTRAAIDAAAAHLAAQTTAGQHLILLVTDGVPDCGQGAFNVLASDAAGAVRAITNAATIGFPTYVAGVAIPPGPAETTLGDMAQAGGLARAATPAYAPVSTGGDLVAAMNALVMQTAGCTFAVPTPPAGWASRSTINVGFDAGLIPQDPSYGWTYTDATMTAIQLHGTSCEKARAGDPVWIIFRCPGIP
jgi:hypothetical protein